MSPTSRKIYYHTYIQRGIAKQKSQLSPSCVSEQTLTSILKNSFQCLSKHLQDKLSAHQLSFQKSRSCVIHLLSLFDKVFERIDSKEKVFAIFLGFSESLNRVPHSILLKQLQSLSGRVATQSNSLLFAKPSATCKNWKLSIRIVSYYNGCTPGLGVWPPFLHRIHKWPAREKRVCSISVR